MRGLLISAILMALAMPSHAMSFTRGDMIGDWLCQTDYQGEKNTGLMRYHADGTADEYNEIIYQSPSSPTLEFIGSHYNWRLEGDKLHMDGFNSLAYYEQYYFLPGGLVRVDDSETAEYQEYIVESYQENNWHYVAFDDKDTHRFYFENGYGGVCKRLK